MAQARAHLPKNLQTTPALKALSKKVLKHYVVKRLSLWNSVKGTFYTIGKYAAAIASVGNYGSVKTADDILKDCDLIKNEIENASQYHDYINLINTLHKKAVEAKEAEIPGASSPSLRTDTYYAIMTLLQEIIKLEFPDLYQAHIARKTGDLNKAKADYKDRFNKGMPTEQVYDDINAHLRELVLLGDRSIFHEAFENNRNLFPKLFSTLNGKFSFLDPNDAVSFTKIIDIQMQQEQGIKPVLEGLTKPNANIPYQLQPDYAMIFCFKELKQSLGYCTACALEEDKKEFGKSFYGLYIANREKFIADNQPDDIAARLKSNPDSPDTSEAEITFLSPSNQEALIADQQLSVNGANNNNVVNDDRRANSQSANLPEAGLALVVNNKERQPAASKNSIVEVSMPVAPASPGKVSQIGSFSSSATRSPRVETPPLPAADQDEEYVQTVGQDDSDEHSNNNAPQAEDSDESPSKASVQESTQQNKSTRRGRRK